MKFLDKVKVINLKESYEKENIKLNDVGVIWEAEIRDNSFYIMFDVVYCKYVIMYIIKGHNYIDCFLLMS